jgi:hypothetical protein
MQNVVLFIRIYSPAKPILPGKAKAEAKNEGRACFVLLNLRLSLSLKKIQARRRVDAYFL